MNRTDTGQRGEKIAADYLKKHGFDIVDTNWRGKNAEIDIIARTRCEMVFVEVRTKTSTAFGSPAESINRTKRRKLIAAAESYIAQHRISGEWRIDFVGIEFHGNTFSIEHIPYAVTADGKP